MDDYLTYYYDFISLDDIRSENYEALCYNEYLQYLIQIGYDIGIDDLPF